MAMTLTSIGSPLVDVVNRVKTSTGVPGGSFNAVH